MLSILVFNQAPKLFFFFDGPVRIFFFPLQFRLSLMSVFLGGPVVVVVVVVIAIWLREGPRSTGAMLLWRICVLLIFESTRKKRGKLMVV